MGQLLTSIELNGLPLYASANSAASAAFLKFTTTIERFGRESLINISQLRYLNLTYRTLPNHPEVRHTLRSGSHKR